MRGRHCLRLLVVCRNPRSKSPKRDTLFLQSQCGYACGDTVRIYDANGFWRCRATAGGGSLVCDPYEVARIETEGPWSVPFKLI